jgi:hypothetical protein
MTHATQFFSMRPEDQQAIGGFYGYMQRQGVTSPAPSVNPANPAPAAGPQDINSTINQMMGLLAKPKAQ